MVQIDPIDLRRFKHLGAGSCRKVGGKQREASKAHDELVEGMMLLMEAYSQSQLDSSQSTFATGQSSRVKRNFK